MDFFSKRNAVILALTQVVVIALGVLSAGCCHKWYATCSMRPPTETTLWAEYGPLALLAPLAWVFIALRVQQRNDDTRGVLFLVYCAGVLGLFLGLFIAWRAGLEPVLRTVGCGGL
jgi:hypothetical protein